jgi:hypothetical protein
MKSTIMILRSIILAGAAVAALGSGPVWAQDTITENLNNTGIPRNAPALGLPSIYGLNPCSSGAAVGVTTPLFGIGGAIANIDKECETRNNAAVVITGLKDEAMAREILCQIKDIRQAARRLGKPCLEDEGTSKVSSAAPANPVQPEQAVAVAQPVIQPVVQPVALSIRTDAPAFCHTRGLDLRLYPDCTGQSASASTVGPSGSVRPPPKVIQTAVPTKPSRTPKIRDGVALAEGRQPGDTSGCGDGKVMTDGKCQAAPGALLALEHSWLRLVALRRVELALAETRRDNASHGAPEPAAGGREPRPARGPQLASAVSTDR